MATVVNRQTMSDADLIAASREGDSDAYGELYRRHVPAARAAARAMCRNRSDADDLVSEAFLNVLRILQNGNGPELAFRPYLLVAVRNRFYDRARRRHEDPIDHPTEELNLRLIEAADVEEDKMLASAAFATLPERWQVVLWHTEIEGRTPAEVAPLLGVAPNAVAALAYRAREGLRQAYLQAHLQTPRDLACRECAGQLGAYVRGALSDRDRRKVDEHLSECAACRALLAELCDTNTMLRAGLLPAIVGVPATAYLSGLGGKGVAGWFVRLSRLQQAGTAAGAVAATVAIAVTAAVVSNGGSLPSVAAPTTTRPPAAVAGTRNIDPGSASSTTRTTVIDGTGAVATTSSVDTTAVPVVGDAAATTTTAAAPVNRVPVRTPPGSTTTAPAPGPTTTAVASEAPPTVPPTVTSSATTTTTVAPIIPRLAMASVQLGIGVLGGEVRVQLTVSATALPAGQATGQLTGQFRTSAATTPGVVVDVALPPGVTLNGADNPAWSCTAAGSCTISSLTSGASSTAVLRLGLSLGVALPISFAPTVSSPPNAVVQSQPLSLTAGTVAGLQMQEFARGAVTAVSNTVVNCVVVLCGLVDVDADETTIDSSTADLKISGSVAKAVLVWSGDSPSADRGTVRLLTPGGSIDVVADQLTPDYSPEYKDEFVAYKDVTSLISTSGTYGVANLQTSSLSYGGWSLIVLTHDSSLPERSLMIVTPLSYVTRATPASIALPTSTSSANAATHVVVSAFEGDEKLLGDTLRLGALDLGSIGDAFHGAIAGGSRNPQLDRNYRVDLIDAVGGASGASSLDFATTDDPVMVAAVGIALDLS